MAPPKTLKGTKLLLQLGDGEETEAFTHPCGITNVEMSWEKTTTEDAVPDCADPDAPDPIYREADTISMSLSGDGVLNTADLATYQAWMAGSANKNCRLTVDAVLADGGGYWSGAFHLTTFTVGRTNKARVTVALSLVSDGAITWTDAAA